MINNYVFKKNNKLFNVLNKEDVELIHNSSISILENTGFYVEDEELFEPLEGLGAKIDKKNKIVKLSEEVVMKAIDYTPKKVTLFDRNGKKNELTKGNTFFTPCGKMQKRWDYSSDSLKVFEEDNAVKAAILIDCLDGIDIARAMVNVSSEKNKYLNWLYTLKHVFLNNTKHCIDNPLEFGEAKMWIELSKELSPDKPIVTIQQSPTSPLKLIKDVCKSLKLCTENNIPISVLSDGVTGATMPYTIAGALTLTNAEILFLITLIQSLNKGNSIIYSSPTSPMDMQTGLVTRGGPEYALIVNGLVEMGSFYNLPTLCGPGVTDSFGVDVQSGIQKTMCYFSAIGNNASICSAAGLLSAALAASYEQLIIDNEIINYMKRFFRGINVNSNSLAVDSINKVGYKGNFLLDKNTVENVRSKEYYHSDIFNIGGIHYPEKRNVLKNANEKVLNILKDHKPDVSKSDIDKILNFVKENERVYKKR